MSRSWQSLLGVALLGIGTGALAAPILWIDDNFNQLGTVDVATGGKTVIGSFGIGGGQTMTDIAFDPSGNLWGISFNSIYTINKTTGAATLVGNHGISQGNALAFSAAGTLYAAGATTTNLYTVNTATGVGGVVGNMGFASGGDLAFNGGNLFLATSNRLVEVNPVTGAGVAVGGLFGVSDVFGLATGDDGVLYATAGQNAYTVNTTTGVATLAANWSVPFAPLLGTAFGTAFVTEAGAPPETSVPEPGTLLLIAAGLIGIVAGRRRALR
ncbi:MAG: PEP-CTERM sorting domain-containing protein [Burkholderiales bacterium]